MTPRSSRTVRHSTFRVAPSLGTTRLTTGTSAGRWVILATVLGSGMALLDATVVNVALPSLGRAMHAGVGALQLVVTAYAVTLASLILLAGTLGDRLGRRRVFAAGVVWFAAASLLCALAPTVGVLVGARALQGIGGALLTPGSLSIIHASFTADHRARAVGAWTAFVGVAAAIGPLVGGYLVEAVSWRAIFLINLPIGGVVLSLALWRIPESRDDDAAAGPLDRGGAAMATLGLGGATYSMVYGPTDGLRPPVVVATLVAVVATVGFFSVERRAPNPMVPLAVFRVRQFTAANLVTFVVWTALGGVSFLLVVVLQTSLGYSPLEAGAASLPITAMMLIFSSWAGGIAERIGPRFPLTAGPLVIAAGIGLMIFIQPGVGYLEVVSPAVTVFGFGVALTAAPVTAVALGALDERHAGLASGVNNAVARMAGLLAVALLPPVVGLSGDAFQHPRTLAAGFHVAMLVTLGIAVTGAVLAFVTIPGDAVASQRLH